MMGLLTDITQRKEAEAALREGEQRYRLLFQSNPHPMWVYDLETLRFLDVNDAAVHHYGYSKAEFLAMTVKDIRPEAEIPRLLDNIAATRDGLNHNGIWKHRKRDGTIIDVEVSAHAITFSGRRAEVVLVQDVTERLALEQRLRQTQKLEAIGQLAGGVAHDFNNAILPIMAYCEMLLTQLHAQDPLRRYAEQIARAAESAANLPRQLLAFSRKQVLQPEVIDLNGIVDGMAKMLRHVLGAPIKIVSRLSPTLDAVKADPGQIEQVLMNLAVNVRDAMPRGGTLTVETSNTELDAAYCHLHPNVTPGRYVVLAVSDTGCGMDRETQARAFEPFFTTKEKGKGTGLGLSSVYGIVTQSGGHVQLYSEPGQGSTFRVYLPAVQEAATTAEAIAPAETQGGGETILVAEDNDAVRQGIIDMLQAYGYTVVSAGDGKEALRIAETHPGTLHVLLTDVVMPEIDGRQLAERLRAVRPEVRIIFMSGYTEDVVIHQGVLHAGIEFVQKPFTPSVLARKVREVLDRRH